jgi:hypothetical protein
LKTGKEFNFMKYLKKELLGSEYKGDVITPERVQTLLNGYDSRMINGASAGKGIHFEGFTAPDEWEISAKGTDVFDTVHIYGKSKFGNTFHTNERTNQTYYIPDAFYMTDYEHFEINCYGGTLCKQRYFVVLVGDQIELRMIDNNAPSVDVTDKAIIRKMENTVLAALKVLELRVAENRRRKEEQKQLSAKMKPLCNLLGAKNHLTAVKRFLKESGDDVLSPLCDLNYVAYIDWKLEYEDVCFNFNSVLKKHKIDLADFDKSESNCELLGEDAAWACVGQYENEDLCFVLIDTGTDGFYVGLVQKCDTEKLESELQIFGYKLISNSDKAVNC